MYKKSFYIDMSVWNNAFSFDKRDNKKLYVPSLKEISSFDEINLWDEVVFEDFDFDWRLSSCKWLENFYEILHHPSHLSRGEGITTNIYLFDNHNHAYYFWYLARNNGLIGDNNLLYHIDEHSDMRDPWKYLLKPESEDMKKVFDYTNFSDINVWNYIIPAQKEGLIGDIIQIRNEDNLLEYLTHPLTPSLKPKGKGIILNLDLDFFQPDLDFIDYELKKKVVLDIAKKATVITVATSPFFIDQKLALKVFSDLFSNSI